MANRTIKVFGHNHAADTNLTVSWGGAQVYNGTLSASTVDYDDIWNTSTDAQDQVELFEFTYNNADDSQTTTHSLSITVNAGSASIGTIRDSACAGAGTTEYASYPGLNEMQRNGATWEGVDGLPPVDLIDGKYYWQLQIHHPDDATLNEARSNMTVNTTAHAINGAAVSAPDGAPSGYAWAGFTFYLEKDDVYTNTTSVYKALVTNPFAGKGWAQTKYS